MRSKKASAKREMQLPKSQSKNSKQYRWSHCGLIESPWQQIKHIIHVLYKFVLWILILFGCVTVMNLWISCGLDDYMHYLLLGHGSRKYREMRGKYLQNIFQLFFDVREAKKKYQKPWKNKNAKKIWMRTRMIRKMS